MRTSDNLYESVMLDSISSLHMATLSDYGFRHPGFDKNKAFETYEVVESHELFNLTICQIQQDGFINLFGIYQDLCRNRKVTSDQLHEAFLKNKLDELINLHNEKHPCMHFIWFRKSGYIVGKVNYLADK